MVRDPALRRALARLDETRKVAIGVDHPLLLKGPDVLASDGGKLMALYAPSASDLASFSGVLVRMALSRMALPTHTRHVLYCSEEAALDEWDRRHFDRVLVREEVRSLETAFLSNDESPGRTHFGTDALRREFFHNYWTALELSDRADEMDKDPRRAAGRDRGRRLELPRWSAKGRRAYSSMIHVMDEEQALYAELPEQRGRVRAAAMRAIEQRVRGMYSLDNGLLYANPVAREFNVSFLAERNDSSPSWDPQQIRRAGAFAGWTLVSGPRGVLPAADVRKMAEAIRKRMEPVPPGGYTEGELFEDDES